jgi:hypothetical protein
VLSVGVRYCIERFEDLLFVVRCDGDIMRGRPALKKRENYKAFIDFFERRFEPPPTDAGGGPAAINR